MPKNEKIVFIATVGQTDLQVLVRKDGQDYRAEIGNIRQFHQALLNGALSYRVEGKYARCKPLPNIKIDWNSGKGEAIAFKDSSCEVVRENQQIILIPAKLMELVESIKSDAKPITAALLFATHRDDKKNTEYTRREPIAAGPILTRWLAQELNLEISDADGALSGIKPGHVTWVNYLDGEMESPGTGRDDPVDREAMRRIDRALQAARTCADFAYLSLGGGLPNFKDQIIACAHYRFAGKLKDRRVSEYDEKEQWTPDRALPHPPSESFRARLQATNFIEQGDFRSAYAVAAFLQNDDEEKPWVDALETTKDYMSGLLDNPENSMPDAIKTLIEISERIQCLNIAIRTEAALWHENYREAAMLTNAFYDTALFDGIKQLMPTSHVDNVENLIKGNTHQLQPLEAKLNKLSNSEKYKPLTNLLDGSYGFNSQGQNEDLWIKCFPNILEESMFDFQTRIYGTQKKFKGRTYGKKATGIKPRKLRNLYVHSSLKTDLANKIKEIYIGAQLWFDDIPQKPPLGHYFLNQKTTRNILKALGIAHEPASYYANLVQELKRLMQEHECR